MDIGIIGAGTVAQAFARRAIAAGHSVAISNSREPQSLASLAGKLGPKAQAVKRSEAAARPLVLLAVPWPKVDAALQDLSTWNGPFLIDATNACLKGRPDDGIARLVEGSSSEYVAVLACGARVVKAMSSLSMSNFASDPIVGSYRRAAFVSGDGQAARKIVADLLESFGFAPVVLGRLAIGGRIQAVGAPIAGHDFFLPWPAPRTFPLSTDKA